MPATNITGLGAGARAGRISAVPPLGALEWSALDLARRQATQDAQELLVVNDDTRECETLNTRAAMNDTQTTGRRCETNADETAIAVEDKEGDREASEAASHASLSRWETIRPRWLAILCGRVILRICPSGKKGAACEGCRLRVFCRCAQVEFEKATVLERRFWAVLAVCGAAVILYCVL